MTPLQRYRADLATHGFQADEHQQRVVGLLQGLHDELCKPVASQPWWRRTLFGQSASPKGLYLWGGPGRGKTYLMDCFFDTLATAQKRRVHFHRFMLEIHRALDALQTTRDPLKTVAAQLAAHSRVLCLDEFHVTDVADAMLLAGLLEALLGHGVVLVITSNMAPEDLYRDGLQRQRFVPAIELLRANTRVVELQGGHDYRRERLELSGTYQVLEGGAAKAWLQERMDDLVACEQQAVTTLRIAGRTLHACAIVEDVAWFDFAQLCQSSRSVHDYLELGREFHTLLLEDVPVMGDEMDEAARRFIHLVDALYDQGVKLIATAADAPERLYTGLRLRPAFERTASRLAEMSGTAYLARPHRAD